MTTWFSTTEQETLRHFLVEKQANLTTQSEGNTAVDMGKRRCKASYTTN
jgi:hypothetical protein